MNKKNYAALKSGTDIRGVASQGVQGEEVTLTDEAVRDIVGAFALSLRKKAPDGALSVAIGHDSRVSAERIKSSAVETLLKAGIDVVDCGLASTPAMFMTTVDLECNAALQITASHHPWNRNGLKFFSRSGGFEGEEIALLLNDAENGRFAESATQGRLKAVDYMSKYAQRLRKMICDGLGAPEETKPLEGWKIAVDAGNGVGGFYAFDVLERLGADVSGSRFTDPDGMFPNHAPNPENPQAMRALSLAVTESGSDFGVIFDTDVDRAACVDGNGNEINRNRLVALAAAIALESNPGGTIVTDSVTSSGLKTFIEQNLGGVHYRFRRGYKNVINEQLRLMREGINCPLAIETSGHAAFSENYYLDDGAYLITKIIIKLVSLGREGLEKLLEPLREPREAIELRFKIMQADVRACGLSVINELEAYAGECEGWCIADDNREGIRIAFPDEQGWLLLRLSVHDPIMPFNVESDINGGVERILKKVKPFFDRCTGLDLSPLNKALG